MVVIAKAKPEAIDLILSVGWIASGFAFAMTILRDLHVLRKNSVLKYYGLCAFNAAVIVHLYDVESA